MAIRQELKRKGQLSKQMNPRKIDELRSGNITSVQFLQNLSVYSELKQEEILLLLNGKELGKILKSVDKPSFLGKKKKQTNRNINCCYENVILFQKCVFEVLTHSIIKFSSFCNFSFVCVT